MCLGICTGQSLFLFIAFMVRGRKSQEKGSNYEPGTRLGRREEVLIVFMLMIVCWDLFLFRSSLARGTPGTGLRIANALIALVLTIAYICIVINLKFHLRHCSLNTGEDNKWTFGQYLTLFVLLAPIYSTLEAFHGGYTYRVELKAY